MTTKFLLKNKTTQEISNLTSVEGELLIDNTKHSIVVMDETTLGGTLLAKEKYVLDNSLPSVNNAEGLYLSVTGDEATWVGGIDYTLLPVGTVLDSFTDLPEEYFLKFDGEIKNIQDYPEILNIYTPDTPFALSQSENVSSNFYNMSTYSELFTPFNNNLRDYSIPKSMDNMVFDGTYYVRILGHEDLNYGKSVDLINYGKRAYYPKLSSDNENISINSLNDVFFTIKVLEAPPEPRVQITQFANYPKQRFDPALGTNVNSFEDAYWETVDGVHQVVINIKYSQLSAFIFNDARFYKSDETWQSNEENYTLYGDSFYLSQFTIEYENSASPTTLSIAWENAIGRVFNVGHTFPPDGSQFKIQRSTDGVTWTTITVAPFSNKATRCYSVVADENAGKIYMTAQALQNLYDPPWNTTYDQSQDGGTNDIIVMSEDHGSTWVEIDPQYRNTGRVLSYNPNSNKLYYFRGIETNQYNISIGSIRNQIYAANTNVSQPQFYPVDVYQYSYNNSYPNYITLKNGYLMYIIANAATISSNTLPTVGDETGYTNDYTVGTQTSLINDSFNWQSLSNLQSEIVTYYNSVDDKYNFTNEVSFCKEPATFSNVGALVTPDRIYAVAKHIGNTYRIYLQREFDPTNFPPDTLSFQFYCDVKLDGFDAYNELSIDSSIDSAKDQNGISKFHWSPLFGFMILTKNKIYYNSDPINNSQWTKFAGLDETKNYQFVTCINTDDGVIVSGMTDIIYLSISEDKFMLSKADTVLLNKYTLSKYIKIK
jgi:hypothetical protein